MPSTSTKYLTKRKGSTNYYVRVPVPLEFQSQVGKKEIWRSLNTPNLSEARRKAHRAVADILDEWETATRAAEDYSEIIEPSLAQIEAAAQSYYSIQVEADIDERSHDSEFVRQVYHRDRHKASIKQLQAQIAVGDYSAINLDYWAEHFGFEFKAGSPRKRDFAQFLMRAEVEASRRFLEHDRGEFGRKAKDALFVSTVPTTGYALQPEVTATATEPTCDPGFEELLSLQEEHLAAQLRPDTLLQRAKAVRKFAEFIAPETSPLKATKPMAREWRNALRKWPNKADQSKAFKGLSFNQVIERNETLGLRVIGARTRNKYLSEVSAFYKWLREEGYIEENIFDHLHERLPKKPAISRTFSDRQLKRLFASPLFTGCAGPTGKALALAGDERIRDWRYWLPILAAFSGARQGELAQLELGDIGVENGIHFVTITSEGEDESKSIKNTYSRRRIPLHSQVIDLGFLNYVEEMRRAGQKRVFPEIKRDAREAFGNVSKFYRKYFEQIRINDDPERKVVFHSFRHRFTDELREYYTHEQFQPLLGHSVRSATTAYGEKEVLALGIRRDMIEKVTYDFIDWGRLK